MEIKSKEMFDSEVLKSDRPVIVDFWATWCGPCRMLAPVVEAIAADYAGKLKVGKVNVDEQPGLAIRYGLDAIPAVLLFRNGEKTAESVGYTDREKLLARLGLAE